MTPKIFQHQHLVQPNEIDELNHVNNIVYLQYVQDIAQAHWEASKLQSADFEIVWVARRHEIDYFKPAFLGDELTVKTFVESFTGVASVRICEIYKAETLIAKARTTWVAVNPETQRPQRIGQELINAFFE
jgi:acyl-CoA thioester hydrolase